MGGTILKQDIVIENEKYIVKGEVDAWETCLWRLKVYGSITRKSDNKAIEFVYEAIDRKVENSRRDEFSDRKSGTLSIIGDLVIILAINSKYCENDPLGDSDLNLESLFEEE